MKIAAIDIGSNAIRLLIADYSSSKGVEILKKTRNPVRLGDEAFGDDGFFLTRPLRLHEESFLHLQH